MDPTDTALVAFLLLALILLFVLTTAEPSMTDYHDPFDQEDL